MIAGRGVRVTVGVTVLVGDGEGGRWVAVSVNVGTTAGALASTRVTGGRLLMYVAIPKTRIPPAAKRRRPTCATKRRSKIALAVPASNKPANWKRSPANTTQGWINMLASSPPPINA